MKLSGRVADVAVAVPALGGERVLRHRVGRAEPRQQRVVDPPVHVDQAHLGQVLVAGEAARGLAGDGGRRDRSCRLGSRRRPQAS